MTARHVHCGYDFFLLCNPKTNSRWSYFSSTPFSDTSLILLNPPGTTRPQDPLMYTFFFIARFLSDGLSPQHSGDKTANGPIPCGHVRSFSSSLHVSSVIDSSFSTPGKRQPTDRTYSLGPCSFPSPSPDFPQQWIFFFSTPGTRQPMDLFLFVMFILFS